MRKIITLLLALILLVGITGNYTELNAEEIDSSLENAFEYEITPYSSEWKDYNVSELKEKLNMSIKDAETMDTETLLNVVLDYPFLGDIYAFNDPLKAIDFLAEQFNGLKVLLEREDLKDIVYNNYMDSTEKLITTWDDNNIDVEERFKHKYIESLLSYPDVFNNLNSEEIDSITLKSEDVAAKINTRSIIVEQPDTFGTTVGTLSAGDLIGSGYIYTPAGTKILVQEYEEMTDDDKDYCEYYMELRHPDAELLRSATYKYNCHSYAWYSTSSSNTWWLEYPVVYMVDGSYDEVTSVESGDRIYYPMPDNQHSGIVSSVNDSGGITVVSKWGCYGLYKHGEFDCPYSSMYLNSYWTR